MVLDFKKTSKGIEQIVILRLVVGFLGQRKQFGWWDCDFLDATGIRFLANIFPRTAWAAALRSASEAACIVHDKALGRIGNYHLFRLPQALEDKLECVIDRIDWSESCKHIESPDIALNVMKNLFDDVVKAPNGPVQVGVETIIQTPTAIRELAAHYLSAFQEGIRCFPYFALEKHGR